MTSGRLGLRGDIEMGGGSGAGGDREVGAERVEV